MQVSVLTVLLKSFCLLSETNLFWFVNLHCTALLRKNNSRYIVQIRNAQILYTSMKACPVWAREL